MLMDAVMLFLGLSLVMTFLTVFKPVNALNAEAARYESQQHQQGLLAVLNDFVKFGVNNQNVSGRVIDLMAYAACKGTSNFNNTLNETVKNVADGLNPGKHFILKASVGSTLLFMAYDWKPSVCLDAISVASVEIPTRCGNISVQYGTWPEQKQVKENCQ